LKTKDAEDFEQRYKTKAKREFTLMKEVEDAKNDFAKFRIESQAKTEELQKTLLVTQTELTETAKQLKLLKKRFESEVT
jgi:hypothetical protein